MNPCHIDLVGPFKCDHIDLAATDNKDLFVVQFLCERKRQRLTLLTTDTPSAFQSGFLVITIFFLPLNGLLPIDSKVFLPIATGIAQVTFLKYFISLGKCQSNSLFLPMALFSAAATTRVDDIILDFRIREYAYFQILFLFLTS